MFPARNKKALAEVANSSQPEWFYGTTWWPVATGRADPIGTISGPQIMKYPKLMQATKGFQGTDRKCVWYIRYIPKALKKRNRNMG
jgi:hypothetical protein